GRSSGVSPSACCSRCATATASGPNQGAPTCARLAQVTSARVWLARPGRLRATHRFSTVQCAVRAAASAFASRTASTASAAATSGTRHEYWIWAIEAGRLSAVACPAVRIASLSDQPPVAGSIESCVVLVSEYMVNSAAFAPGARAAEWEAGMGLSGSAYPQVSGSGQVKV